MPVKYASEWELIADTYGESKRDEGCSSLPLVAAAPRQHCQDDHPAVGYVCMTHGRRSDRIWRGGDIRPA